MIMIDICGTVHSCIISYLGDIHCLSEHGDLDFLKAFIMFITLKIHISIVLV